MRALIAIVTLIGVSLHPASVVDGGEAMRMQVSPELSRAPALLIVRISVDAASDNRYLEVTAESPEFYRSSQVPVDGRNATALKVFEFANLPTGQYRVTGVLFGAHGPRASVSRDASVVPSPGAGR